MHELSLAFDLIDRASEIAKREAVKKVISINVRIGPESGVNTESFLFAFPEAAKNTILSGAKLEITPGSGREFQFINMEVEDV